MPYSIEHRSTTQDVDLFLLRRWIAQEFGWTQAPELLDDQQINTVDDTINAGVRMYCYPPVLPQPFSYHPDEGHEWSFMRGVMEMITEDSQHEYPLPLDFEHFNGQLVFGVLNSNVDAYLPLEHTSVSRLLYLLGTEDNTTAPPFLYATPLVEQTGEQTQGQKLLIYPRPDGQYRLRGQYQRTVRLLTETNPFPPGGQSHGAGILAACLAAAELRLVGGQGPKYKDFLAHVAASIQRDFNRLPGLIGSMNNIGEGVYSHADARHRGLLYMKPATYTL